jgi:hypothetical protein
MTALNSTATPSGAITAVSPARSVAARARSVSSGHPPRPLLAFNVRVRRTYLETYRVQAEDEEEAMRNWMDGDFRGQDEDALDSGPLSAVEVKP